jgi:hypothetical protein
MNLRAYYEAIRKIEAGIADAEVVVVSCETADGGRDGVRSTVPRSLAARLIADGKVVLADSNASIKED